MCNMAPEREAHHRNRSIPAALQCGGYPCKRRRPLWCGGSVRLGPPRGRDKRAEGISSVRSNSGPRIALLPECVRMRRVPKPCLPAFGQEVETLLNTVDRLDGDRRTMEGSFIGVPSCKESLGHERFYPSHRVDKEYHSGI
jgi:hypothetical protein